MAKIILFILFIAFGARSFSQSAAITGHVTDDKGIGIPFVIVVVKGTTKGICADADGQYKISAIPGKDTLVFSSVSYVEKEQRVNTEPIINVTLSHWTPQGIDLTITVPKKYFKNLHKKKRKVPRS